jgi:dTDP-4-amino-4,6-dideoxygalactose transaminase
MTDHFALFGAPPAIVEPMRVGQRYFPAWDRYCEAIRGIFERQYYTEYGPLNRRLEQRLQQYVGVRHAICVTNETVALMMVADAMGLSGKVIVPRRAPATATQSLAWAGLEPVFCEVDPQSHRIDVARVPELMDESVSAILGVHPWGGACDVKALAGIAAAHGIQLYFDASQAFGCMVEDVRIGTFGRCEIFSFHEANILNATEGGCICTNDDSLAARLRTMRSSSGAGEPAVVVKTVNGRMSEAQAATALMSLDDFDANRQTNEILHRAYATGLRSVLGLRLIEPVGVSLSNFQCVACLIDEREYGLRLETLLLLLEAENVFAEEVTDIRRLPAEDCPADVRCIQLPIGACARVDDVERVCAILSSAQRLAPEIRTRPAALQS